MIPSVNFIKVFISPLRRTGKKQMGTYSVKMVALIQDFLMYDVGPKRRGYEARRVRGQDKLANVRRPSLKVRHPVGRGTHDLARQIERQRSIKAVVMHIYIPLRQR